MLGKLLKFLLVLVVLAVIALIGYAYLGDLSPEREDVSQPAVIKVN